MSYLELIKLASPEAVVVITALVVLAVGLTSRRTGTICSSIAVLGLAGAIGAVFMLPRNANLFGGMLVITPLTSLFKIICLALAFFTICLVRSEKSLRDPGEYLAIILLATVGLMLLVGSEELLMIFIGLELLGLSLYVMAAFDRTDVRSAEAGLKYFLFGSTYQRVHAFRNQFDLWHVGKHWPGCDLGQIGGRAGATFACDRHHHDAHRLRVQNCRCAVSLVGP